ncbi:MAG: c-type cytochrome [Gammaproteobacteria bacterium]
MNNFIILVAISILTGGAMVSATLSAAEAGKTVADVYLKNCSICHGDKGDAQTRARSGMSPKPRDFTTAEAAMELTRERMIKSVTDGRSGTAMVGHKGRLSEKQIASLVDYIRTNFMRVPVAAQGGVTEAVSLGEKVYTKNCSVCHGDTGNTAYWAKNGLNPPPRDFTSPGAQSDLTRQRMIKSVTSGRPGTGMMPFNTRLSTEEIAAVVGFIRFKFMGVNPDMDTGGAPLAQVAGTPTNTRTHSKTNTKISIAKLPEPTPVSEPQPVSGLGLPGTMTGAMSSNASGGHVINVDMTEVIPNKLKGDMKWGREFYMKNCFTCHGVKGEGNGPRAYFNRPRPRDFTSDASRQILNRPRVFDSIAKGRVGTVMPAWSKVLTEQEIANLTEFVFQAFIMKNGVQGKDAAVPDTKKKSGKKKAS